MKLIYGANIYVFKMKLLMFDRNVYLCFNDTFFSRREDKNIDYRLPRVFTETQ